MIRSSGPMQNSLKFARFASRRGGASRAPLCRRAFASRAINIQRCIKNIERAQALFISYSRERRGKMQMRRG